MSTGSFSEGWRIALLWANAVRKTVLRSRSKSGLQLL